MGEKNSISVRLRPSRSQTRFGTSCSALFCSHRLYVVILAPLLPQLVFVATPLWRKGVFVLPPLPPTRGSGFGRALPDGLRQLSWLPGILRTPVPTPRGIAVSQIVFWKIGPSAKPGRNAPATFFAEGRTLTYKRGWHFAPLFAVRPKARTSGILVSRLSSTLVLSRGGGGH